jgi:hypothetical protein
MEREGIKKERERNHTWCVVVVGRGGMDDVGGKKEGGLSCGVCLKPD